MSSPVFKQAFEIHPHVDPGEAMAQTAIKIIALNPTAQRHASEQWYQDLLAEGVSITYLANPCTLHRIEGRDKTLAEVESLFVFGDFMNKKVLEYPNAGAIAISHLRALHELRTQHPKAGLLIVLEEDVKPRVGSNTTQLMAALIANWFGNPSLRETAYCALTFSEWHAGYSTTARQESRRVKGSHVQPYFWMKALPAEVPHFGQGVHAYKFIGQGARALAYSPEFADHILNKRVNTFYDLHVLSEVSMWRHLHSKDGKDNPNMATFVDPPIFNHEGDFSSRFRGSGRLESNAVNKAEQDSFYITVDLSKEWGFCNRVGMICLMGGICSLFRMGMYILWSKTKACNACFDELVEFDTESQVYQDLPFVKVYDNSRDSNWMAAKSNQNWCKANFHSQCQVDMGLEFFFQTLRDLPSDDEQHLLIKKLVPSLQEKIDSAACWQLLKVKPWIQHGAEEFIGSCRGKMQRQVAIHVRRGDHKFLNCIKKSQEEEDSDKRCDILHQWVAADLDVIDHISITKNTCSYGVACNRVGLARY